MKALSTDIQECDEILEDEAIIDLYWDRNENAIAETSLKYEKLCYFISKNILSSSEDSEEVVNDTYFALWNAIPPKRPNRFSVFVSRVTRNLALKKFEYNSAAKRNPEAVCSLDELSDCISGKVSVETELENRRVEHLIDTFLWRQSEEKRHTFIRRYWYFESLQSISIRTGFSESKIKSMLFQMRKSLREYLESEGVEL